MSEYQKDLLTEIVENWSEPQLTEYINQLIRKRSELDDWIRHVQSLRRKVKKKPLDNGKRGG